MACADIWLLIKIEKLKKALDRSYLHSISQEKLVVQRFFFNPHLSVRVSILRAGNVDNNFFLALKAVL